MKLGTEDNRIKLVQENNKRNLLLSHSTFADNGGYDLGKIPTSNSDGIIFLNNIMTNQHLSDLDIRIAYHLWELMCGDDSILFGELLCVVVRSSDVNLRFFGEDGCLYFSKTNAMKFDFVDLEKFSLLDYLNDKKRLRIQSNELITSLNNLHSFYYLTCTEIADINSAESRKGTLYEKEEILLSSETKLAFIRINSHFERIDMTNRWFAKTSNNSKSNTEVKNSD
ncbi:hypothetical protein C2869_06170 [Saccharobesus litoralis]|uniref:Uncharacterized protein n=1 Tax=Saccharobesus litoralis TaxID=2172099 RepID=A0A2S0VPC4_9ALTE|nr:hypothetical protein [Saccharobesus litoralis]AWB66049.1 hypothetical protein C2869_06170 [Saccharobesus litoralis]